MLSIVQHVSDPCFFVPTTDVRWVVVYDPESGIEGLVPETFVEAEAPADGAPDNSTTGFFSPSWCMASLFDAPIPSLLRSFPSPHRPNNQRQQHLW